MVSRWATSFHPPEIEHDPELIRRARLQISFGLLGALFGSLYALFYLCIGHYWGAGIIVVCSTAFGLVPPILKRWGCLRFCGHLFAFTLLIGFGGLCAVEGGLHGHAIAWMASIPLCVLLLVESRAAFLWLGVSFLITAFFGVCDLAGVHFPETYPPHWHSLVSAAGYLGLVPFMAILGLVFERTRRQAHEKLKRTMEDLSLANERLLQLNEEKNEFLGIAAHDLKSPLSIIVGYGNELQILEEPTQEEVNFHANYIMHSADRMLNLINNLLDVRAIEEGKVHLEREPCDLKEMMESVHRYYHRVAVKKQIHLRYDIAPLDALADQSALYQVIENLVSNAIKYSPPDTTVFIYTSMKNGTVSIAVQDQGPGLSEEDQARLFSKFTRLTPRPTGDEGSNGLGLWIVRRLAEAMDGQVWCESELGKGSTFGVTLPIAKARHLRKPDDEPEALAAA